MSHSYKTEKPSVQASRNLVREGGVVKPLRIIKRKPFHGDIHPLNKRQIRNLLKLVPDEYVYGLKAIELRPRNGEIGCPFGQYLRNEKIILLYSLPMNWGEIPLGTQCISSVEMWNANISDHGEKYKVVWENKVDLFFWFFTYVLTHELGHHYHEQYKHRNGTRVSHSHNELLADIHSERVNEKIFSIFRRFDEKGS